MATLNMVVTSKAAPITTQMRRFDKGVEQFYYASLFSTSPAYANKADPWRSWLKMGFHLGLKDGPPDASQADRLEVTVRPDGKYFELQASSSNNAELQKLHTLLQSIEALRGSLAGKDGAARAKELVANDKIAQQLVKPVVDSLNRSAFRPDEVESFMGMIERGLIALTDDEITTIKASIN